MAEIKHQEESVAHVVEQSASENNKLEKYKEMMGDSSALFVLSMDIKKINEKETYKPTSYGDVDVRGFMGGGHAIVVATAELSHYFPEVKIITTTRDEKEDRPTHAKIYAEKLARLGVSEKMIALEEKSTNTTTELIEMVKMARKNDWKSVSVMTGENHIERVRTMIDYLEELAKKIVPNDKDFFESWEYFEKGKKLQVHLISAEEVLPMRDRRYQRIIETVRNSDLYKRRVEAEKRGIEQIKNGTYGKRQEDGNN